MQKEISLQLGPATAGEPIALATAIAAACGVPAEQITGHRLLKQSIDARGRDIKVNVKVLAFIDEPFVPRNQQHHSFPHLSASAPRVVVIGAGPAGLFAALELIQLGLRPIVIDRGKDVKSRRRDLAAMNKAGIVNPESNYCFGEGGAGTYSDGKLYTRSNKRGNVQKVLEIFHQFGADEKILSQSHPHIGTNKLPQIITAMREAIVAAGGEVLFEKKLIGFEKNKDRIKAIQTADGDSINGEAFLLATGHSARDVFTLLHQENWLIEAKPFALGVRVEHPQAIIDAAQYHCEQRGPYLPPASYSLVEQVGGRGVFSFCMCPGGIIAPAATAPGEIVVNGWSPSKRNNPYANSGMVVTVDAADAWQYFSAAEKKEKQLNPDHPLLLMAFQAAIEQKAFAAGGGNLQAPAQRLTDFGQRQVSGSLPQCSYLPGIVSADLQTVLPSFVYQSLAGGFAAFGKKIRSYYSSEAVVVATESRTSSPVRIPRDPIGLQHPQVANLYPCAEGAGYAGGIVSAAMDGQKCATAIAAVLKP
ncbi:MAG: FAD-binding protein [Sphingobacteriia bacterium]|nr:MAG: FAD-binding protein [Sphingobacteriia bacterium]